MSKLNDYELIKLINYGEFGSVYKCKKLSTGDIVALKKDKNILLKHEANIYLKLKEVKNIPRLLDFFIKDNIFYLTIELMELNLIEFKNRIYNNNNYFDKINNIFMSIIKTIEQIHNHEIIHRDLKPNNICFNKNLQPIIIDFGLSKQYIIDNKHIEEKKINSIIGSVNFSSKNVLNLIEPSRRDDIESILNIYFYMLLDNNEYVQFDKLQNSEKKEIIFLQDFLNKINKSNDRLINAYKYCRKMKFTQKPNYRYILELMID